MALNSLRPSNGILRIVIAVWSTMLLYVDTEHQSCLGTFKFSEHILCNRALVYTSWPILCSYNIMWRRRSSFGRVERLTAAVARSVHNDCLQMYTERIEECLPKSFRDLLISCRASGFFFGIHLLFTLICSCVGNKIRSYNYVKSFVFSILNAHIIRCTFYV